MNGHVLGPTGVCRLCGAEADEHFRACEDVRAEVRAWVERAHAENIAIGRMGDWKRHRRRAKIKLGGPVALPESDRG